MNDGIESRGTTKSSKVDKALKGDDGSSISQFEAVGVSKDLNDWLLVFKYAQNMRAVLWTCYLLFTEDLYKILSGPEWGSSDLVARVMYY